MPRLGLVLGLLLVQPLAALAGDGLVLISDVPHVRQKPDFCGEACVEMWLRHLGREITQDQVFDIGEINPLHGRGLVTAEMAAALARLKFKPGKVWFPVNAATPESFTQDMDSNWQALLADLKAGIPSIICMNTGGAASSEHFRLILGYDPGKDEVIYNEPAEDKGAGRRISRAALIKLWPLRYAPEKYTVVRLRLEGTPVKEVEDEQGFTRADYAQHMMELKKKLPGQGFSVSIIKPFMVVAEKGDSGGPAAGLSTVEWTVAMLRHDFFKNDPAEIIDIWLFRGAASYKKNAKEVFGDNPDTPYGYYSSAHRALIMNISTGGGTLVHEIVHPYMRANFPGCPTWFDEGLASLYEQSCERGGHIAGLTNWRLAGLQEAIKAGSVPSFEKLASYSQDEFYNHDKGTNYAQARYLCYYLQEQGKLGDFYRAFVKDQKDDPTGFRTLKKALGEEDMAAFKAKWEKYVLTLRFNG